MWSHRKATDLEGLPNSDWWSCSLEAPRQLYSLEFVFNDPSTGIIDNNRSFVSPRPAPFPPLSFLLLLLPSALLLVARSVPHLYHNIRCPNLPSPLLPLPPALQRNLHCI